jgi:hypothetical protein
MNTGTARPLINYQNRMKHNTKTVQIKVVSNIPVTVGVRQSKEYRYFVFFITSFFFKKIRNVTHK